MKEKERRKRSGSASERKSEEIKKEESRLEQWRDVSDVFDRDENGIVLFKVQANSPQELFCSIDPAQTAEKSLDPQIEEYFTDALEALGLSLPLRIEVVLPCVCINTPEAQVVPAAMANYFHYRALQKKRSLRKTIQKGKWSLLVSTIFLCFCLALETGLSKLLDLTVWTSWATDYVVSALEIASWVAMWDPIGLLLHSWRPIRHEYKLFCKLRDTEVKLVPSETQVDTLRLNCQNVPSGVKIPKRSVSRFGITDNLVRKRMKEIQQEIAENDGNGSNLRSRMSFSMASLAHPTNVVTTTGENPHMQIVIQHPTPRRSMSNGLDVAQPSIGKTPELIEETGMVSPNVFGSPFVVVVPHAHSALPAINTTEKTKTKNDATASTTTTTNTATTTTTTTTATPVIKKPTPRFDSPSPANIPSV